MLIIWAASMDAIFGAHGVMPKTWRDYGDGTLTYGSTRPENREVLALLQTWYKDGLIHPDFYTFGPGDSFSQFTSQEVGVYWGAYWLLGRMQAVEEENPGAKWTYFSRLEGPEGQDRPPGRQCQRARVLLPQGDRATQGRGGLQVPQLEQRPVVQLSQA